MKQSIRGGIAHLFMWVAGISLIIASAMPAVFASPPDSRLAKRVVVLYSEPLDTPVTEKTQKGIRQVLSGNPLLNVQLFSEYLDLSRFREVHQREALAELLRRRYRDGGVDLVISVGVPAAVFLLEEGESVFPAIPIVVSSVPEALVQRLDASPLRARTTGVFYPMDRGGLVKNALALLPQTRVAVLVSGAFEYDRIRTTAFHKAIEAFGEKLQLLDLTGLSMGDLVAALKQIPPDSVIFYSTFFVDRVGRSFVPRDVLRILSDTANAPIFSPYEQYLGYGIVGGHLVSMTLQGKKAAEMAASIISGNSPASIPFDDGSETYVASYDWRQLKRWSIGEGALPAGSTVLFRELGAWDLYKHYIIGVLSLVLLESMLILALVINLQKRKRAEFALRSNREDLRTLAGRLISSQEEELSRLAREFHDDLAQRLAAAAIESGTLELQAKHIDPSVLERIGRIKEQLIALSEDVHAISRQIHPSILKDLGLVQAINSQCLRFSDTENIPAAFHTQGVPDNLPEEAALCIYRIIQESLRNIARHACARNVEIALRCEQDRIQLKIMDDGIGFIPESVRRTPGIGLASMRERVQYVNGEFSIHSEPGKGTAIEVSVPLERRTK